VAHAGGGGAAADEVRLDDEALAALSAEGGGEGGADASRAPAMRTSVVTVLRGAGRSPGEGVAVVE
jgi:hypothetical protein